MKKLPTYFARFEVLTYMVLISFALSSCNNYFFSQPQPVDRKDRLHFPKAFRGTWHEEEKKATSDFRMEFSYDSSGQPVVRTDSVNEKPVVVIPDDGDSDSDKDSESLIVSARYIRFVNITRRSIDKGVPLKPGGYNPTQFANDSVHLFGTIEYDSSGKPVDTLPRYLFSQNLIYEIQEENHLEPGYQFDSTNQKKIKIREVHAITVDLGHNGILRKLNKRFWVFNTYNSTDENNDWWIIFIFEKVKPGVMRVWTCNEKTGSLPCMLYNNEHTYPNYFFDCKWTADEMLQLLHDGYFTPGDRWFH